PSLRSLGLPGLRSLGLISSWRPGKLTCEAARPYSDRQPGAVPLTSKVRARRRHSVVRTVSRPSKLDSGRSTDQVEQFTVQTRLHTPAVTVTDVVCSGACRHKSDEECATATHLVFPYRGVYVRHIGRDDAVAEANQVLFFNAWEGYRISHPLGGGD